MRLRPAIEMCTALVRPLRTWVLGPGARWVCPAFGCLLVAGGLIGFLASGSH